MYPLPMEIFYVQSWDGVQYDGIDQAMPTPTSQRISLPRIFMWTMAYDHFSHITTTTTIIIIDA